MIAATAVGRNARVDPARNAAADPRPEAGCLPGTARVGLPALPP